MDTENVIRKKHVSTHPCLLLSNRLGAMACKYVQVHISNKTTVSKL